MYHKQFGNEVKLDSKDENPFRYCGEYYDKETEELYLRARYYQPTVGRFLTRDAYTGENDHPLSLHLYTYCENDGVNAWDPSGHYSLKKNTLKKMSWKESVWMNKKGKNKISKINKILKSYNITKKASVAMFIATCSHESGYGESKIELGSRKYFLQKKYKKRERGAGYIQITWRKTHLKFLEYVGDDFKGKKTASYIAQNYPWDAACWEWAVDVKGDGVKLNDYVNKHGFSKEVFLVTQYFLNGYKSGIDSDLNAVRRGIKKFKYDKRRNKIVIYKDKPENGKSYNAPQNWPDRNKAFNKAKTVFGY